MKVRKALTPKKVARYFAVFFVGWISYKIYSNLTTTGQSEGRHKPLGPRDIGHQGRGGRDYSQDGPEDLNLRVQQKSRYARDKQRNNNRPASASDSLYRQNGNENDEDDIKPGDAASKLGKEAERSGMKFHEEADDKFDFHEEAEETFDRDGAKVQVNHKVKDRRDYGVGAGEERGGGGGGEMKDEEKGVNDEDSLRFNDKQGRQQQAHPVKSKQNDAAFQVEPQIDWALEEELQKRRKNFLDEVAKRAEEYDPETYKDMHERDDHLAFVTVAGNRSSWLGLLQFVYSVQYFYPDSDIGIYDLGLTEERREKLQNYCRVSVIPTYMTFWPEYLRDLSKTLWKPLIWQMALAHFGHMVFVEPERFLSKKNMKDYIEHSRRHGLTVVGRKLPYSPYVVTHPEMYYFLNVDTRKLQRVAMFEPTMIIMHNAEPVRHEFMRFLVSCSLEEYCIAPPGSQHQCDQRLFPGSKKYANCHRYDLSAMNILLYKWFGFKSEEFLVRDIATAHYDGKDVSSRIRTCPKKDEV